MNKFKQVFDYNIQNFVPIDLSKINIDQEVESIINAKRKERHHQIDRHKQVKRWTTGLLSEIAVGFYLKENFSDLTTGNSSFYNHSDLKKLGLNVGVKSSNYGNFPLINKHNKNPEIIVVKKGDIFFITGVALPNVLNTYQSDDLVKSPFVKKRNVKTGFYGFNYLLPFSDIEDLKIIEKILKKETA